MIVLSPPQKKRKKKKIRTLLEKIESTINNDKFFFIVYDRTIYRRINRTTKGYGYRFDRSSISGHKWQTSPVGWKFSCRGILKRGSRTGWIDLPLQRRLSSGCAATVPARRSKGKWWKISGGGSSILRSNIEILLSKGETK